VKELSWQATTSVFSGNLPLRMKRSDAVSRLQVQLPPTVAETVEESEDDEEEYQVHHAVSRQEAANLAGEDADRLAK
jgi:hypothetical protein